MYIPKTMCIYTAYRSRLRQSRRQLLVFALTSHEKVAAAEELSSGSTASHRLSPSAIKWGAGGTCACVRMMIYH